jgi:NADPH:quinone reductase-like Zn-dependent oxidoreductase
VKAVISRAGSIDGLRIEETATPAVPDDGLLIHVRASSINIADLFAIGGAGRTMNRLVSRTGSTPSIPGTDFAGIVEAVGGAVTAFHPGDEVFGSRRGALAEYLCCPADGVVAVKPATITFEQAAAVPLAGTTALQAVRDHGRVRAGQKVLVNGSSGAVGPFLVQIAKASGAAVTAVCSPANVEMSKSVGADRVIDYTTQDFTRDSSHYDVILDVAGSRRWKEYLRVLNPDGTFVVVGASAVMHGPGGMFRVLRHIGGLRVRALRSGPRIVVFVGRMKRPDLDSLCDMLADGRIRPVIDRRYEPQQIAEAFHYLDQGHSRAKIVITGFPLAA